MIQIINCGSFTRKQARDIVAAAWVCAGALATMTGVTVGGAIARVVLVLAGAE